MKHLGLFLCVIASLGFAQEPDTWISPESFTRSTSEKAELPVADVFEVVASMSGNAESELQKNTFIPLSDVKARKYTGHYYICPKGKRPYLVRAVAGFAGTGKFQVYRVGQSIWVAHESLGRGWASARTAMVVNLDFEPTAAYATVSIIE